MDGKKYVINKYRKRILLLLFIVLIPFTLFNIYKDLELHKDREKRVLESAHIIFNAINKDHQDLINISKVLLNAVNKNPAILDNSCSSYLNEVKMDNSFFTNLAISNKKGELVCSALNKIPRVSKTAMPALEKAIQTGKFSSADGLVSKNHGLPIIPLSIPINEDRYLMAGLSINWLGKLSHKYSQSSSFSTIILDSNNKILTTYPQSSSQLNQQIKDKSLLKLLNSKTKTFEYKDKTYLHNDYKDGIKLIVTINKKEAFKEIDSLFLLNVAVTIGIIILALTLGVFVANILFLKDTKDLIEQTVSSLKVESLKSLLKNIAHHWRQPLNVISLNTATVMLELEKENINRAAALAKLEKSNKLIQSISNTITDFATLFNQEDTKKKFLIEAPINKSLEILDPEIKNLEIEIETTIEEVRVHSYNLEIVQVVTNILNNSIDAIVKSAAKEKKIQILAKKEQDILFLTINDSGGGASKETLEKIFEPYSSTKFPASGTGIGLFMVKVIVEKNLGGKIAVYNKEKGLTVEIQLPL